METFQRIRIGALKQALDDEVHGSSISHERAENTIARLAEVLSFTQAGHAHTRILRKEVPGTAAPGGMAAQLRAQQIEPAEYHDTAEHDHRDGVLAEVENRGGEPRRDAEGADAGHRVFLECVMK
ncbi:hypothetical protein [Burkholderia sp. BE12]|uniref:hypothetical protein n=1 Tax=Burkholderia sp. BE12 TaxID=2082394 RepID=UPI0018F8A30B|nr:hypothetical protein [Burkholderia sp. BE12]